MAYTVVVCWSLLLKWNLAKSTKELWFVLVNLWPPLSQQHFAHSYTRFPFGGSHNSTVVIEAGSGFACQSWLIPHPQTNPKPGGLCKNLLKNPKHQHTEIYATFALFFRNFFTFISLPIFWKNLKKNDMMVKKSDMLHPYHANVPLFCITPTPWKHLDGLENSNKNSYIERFHGETSKKLYEFPNLWKKNGHLFLGSHILKDIPYQKEMGLWIKCCGRKKVPLPHTIPAIDFFQWVMDGHVSKFKAILARPPLRLVGYQYVYFHTSMHTPPAFRRPPIHHRAPFACHPGQPPCRWIWLAPPPEQGQHGQG